MKIRKIPLLFKWLFTAFMVVFMPVYWINYGPTNFLWFSDVALILSYIAVITEIPLIASMAAVGGLFLELLWLLDFFLLLFGIHLTTITDYMLNSSIPLWLRGFSLFHLFLVPLFIWLIVRLKYDRRAWISQSVLTWFIIFFTWTFTDPSLNINWVFWYKKLSWVPDPIAYLLLEGVVLMGVYSLTHFLLLPFCVEKRVSRPERD